MFYKQLFEDVLPQEPPDPELFGKWEIFDPYPVPPAVRTIEITPELIEQDRRERERREGEVSAVWPAKIGLSRRNL